MPRKASGQLLTNGDGTKSVRIRTGPGNNDRPRFRLPRRVEARDARAKLLADLAERLRLVAGPAQVEKLLRFVAAARTEKGLAEAVGACEDVAAGVIPSPESAMAPTFVDFAADWTSGKLRKRYPDHVRDKEHTGDIQILRDYVEPVLASTRLPDVTRAHAEEVMARLPSRLSPRTRLKVAQTIRMVLSLAVYPGCHIDANPIPREWMPKVGVRAAKAKSCLYPVEDAKLVSCTEVILERRLAYGILMREGLRASELAELRWRDVDLDHGRVRLDANKTDDPRAWALSPDVARVLAWWKKRTHAEDGDLVLGIDLKSGAAWLRGKTWDPKTRHKDEPGDLRNAGITRAELFERSKTRQPFRLHDLRATFVTVSLANGKTEQWVTDRTGHKSSQMIALYSRQARTWAETNMGTFQPLDELLPEMAQGKGGDPSPREPKGTSRTSTKRREGPAHKSRRRARRRAGGAPGVVWAANGPHFAPPARLERATFALGKRCSIH